MSYSRSERVADAEPCAEPAPNFAHFFGQPMPRAGSYCSHVRPRQDLSSCSQSEEDDEPRAERTEF